MAEQSPQKQSAEAEAGAAERNRAGTAEGTRAGVHKRQLGPDQSGTRLGDFLLLRRIGAGGMGEVYLAQQVSLKRQVALKVIRPDLTADATALKRFAVEAEAAAKLTHANIVQIYASGLHDGTSYMALEYVHGMNLRDYVTKKGPLNAKVAVKVMEQVAAALHHAGETGVVHRDIKPDNILLTRKGEVKVADFGLARLRAETHAPVSLTQTGVTMGTPLYMSPEQVEGKPLDPRSDLYSFGVTGYYMLAGQPPYRGETALAVAVQHIKAEPAPLGELRPDLPGELCRIVHKLMAKDPDQRYQTGRQVVRDLQKLRDELAVTEKSEQSATGQVAAAVSSEPATPDAAKRDPLMKRIFRPQAMHRNWVWWLAASVLVGLTGGAAYGWYLRAPDLRPRDNDAQTRPLPIPWEQMPQQETARAQYEYAVAIGQFMNAEAAWLAVMNYFPTEPDWVRRARLQLGRHYLDEHELVKAENHFKEMAGDPDPKTRMGGETGLAAVLCLRDRPLESLDALFGVIESGEVGQDRILVGLILWTLERNYRNLGQEWNDEKRRWALQKLDQLRFGPPGSRPGAERPGPGR